MDVPTPERDMSKLSGIRDMLSSMMTILGGINNCSMHVEPSLIKQFHEVNEELQEAMPYIQPKEK